MSATIGAQRASASPHLSRLVLLVLALAGALVMTGTQPAEVAAATPSAKVVIVVGPVGSRTAEFKAAAKRLARQARSHGARVIEIHSPWATWSRVVRASRGANLLIYLGHGNGWPSPYGPFQPYTKNGLGLNPSGGADNVRVAYRGEYHVRRQLRLAPNAVVLLHKLCYASGNAEGSSPTHRRWVAKARADFYARGFQQAGARAVFAIGLQNPGFVLQGLFASNKTMRQIFWSAPGASRRDKVAYNPKRSNGRAILDPDRGRYYFRSVVGALDMRASAWR